MSEKNRIVAKKKGFSFLSFFLGILIGIIILAGALFGVGYFAVTADLDNVMGTVGFPNKDEDGNNKYVNTDADNGGVENALQLLQRVMEMARDSGELTLGEIENLLPVAGELTVKLCDAFSQYVIIDTEELKQVKFSEFGAYVNNVVMEIRPAAFIDGEMNNLVKLLLEGVEADCVTVDGTVYPLYSDENNESDDKNYAYSKDGVWYVAQKNGDGFTATDEPYVGDAEALLPTGNYYTADSEKVYIDPITIGSLTGTGGMGALGRASITELLGDSEDNAMVEKLLGDITVDDFMNGEVNFDEKINQLEISDFVEARADDKVMAFFAYGLSNVVKGEDGNYTAIYKLGDEDIPVNVTVNEEGNITGVTDMNGQPVKGLTVENISTISDKIDVSIFLDVTVDNKIIAYLAYGITGLQESEDGNYTATLKVNDGKETVNVNVREGKITGVTIAGTGENVAAANISELSERVDGVFNELTIGELIDPGESKLLQKLGGYTLKTISEGIDDLEITDVMDVPADSAIMAYLAYGITKLDTATVETAGKGTALLDGEKVYLKIEEGETEDKKVITGVYKTEEMNGDPVPATKINDISDRIDGIMNDLTLGELITIGGDNTILNALKNSTVKNLSENISNLTINELYADEIYGGKVEGGSSKKAEMKKVKRGNDGDIDFNAKYLYYEFVDGAYKLVNSNKEDNKEVGKLTALPEDGKDYYTYGEPTEFWQLLVTEKESSEEEGDECAYSLNHLTDMIDNITHNMQYFTLRSLSDAGILTFDDGVLDTSIPDGILSGSQGSKTLGDLTIPDAIKAMVEIITKLNELQQKLPYGS